MNTNVLVTGGAGYIGSHTCKLLKQYGFNPIAYDNLCYGHEWAVKWGAFEKGDILDRIRLEHVFKSYKPIAVIHFAAYAYVGESVEHPNKYYLNNIVGSYTLLEVMRLYGTKYLIFSSTCSTYGVPDVVPISEGNRQNPINPYGNTKLTVERMISDFSNAYNLSYVCLRYFNAAGADPECEIGEDHEPEPHLIPNIMQVALGEKPYLNIFGDDYKTYDGTCVRDYIHVTDLANAHVLSLDYLLNNGKSKVYNLGNGNGYSVKSIVDRSCKVTGIEIPVKILQRRKGDPATLIANSDLIRHELAWSPNHSDIGTILSTAWRWAQKKQLHIESSSS